MSKHDHPVVKVIKIEPELEALVVKLDNVPRSRICGRLACTLRGRQMPGDLLADERDAIEGLVRSHGSPEAFKQALQKALETIGESTVTVHYYGAREVTAVETGERVTRHIFAFGDTQTVCTCMYP